MQVHPSYDPIDSVWFTESGITAHSLATLQEMLPGAKIKGYYPNGYGEQWTAPKPADTSPDTIRGVETLVATGEVNKPKPEPESKPELPVLRPAVFTVEKTPRKNNPTQYALRFGMPAPGWTPEDDNQLRRLAKQGLSAGQIAVALGALGQYRTRNAVIGRAHRKKIAIGPKHLEHR